ncbi:MAG: monovalent cation/H(+) antiporter subunit G [Fimbriimonas sp.]
MRDAIASLLLLIGAVFTLLAALGLARLPDLFMRLQATTKASTLGVGALAIAVAVHYASGGITARAMLVLAFVFITAPAGAHAIARAAHRSGVPLWTRTVADELGESESSPTEPKP